MVCKHSTYSHVIKIVKCTFIVAVVWESNLQPTHGLCDLDVITLHLNVYCAP